jgi:amino acid transporter
MATAVHRTAVSSGRFKLSAHTALTLEALSVSIIISLCIAAYVHHGSVIDRSQLTLSGAHFGGIIDGTVLAIFSFVGFESSASLAVEARNPLRSVRRAVLWSLAGVGLFYVVVSYAQILGFAGSHPGFAASTAPLPGLANLVGLHTLVPFIDAGVTVSMFACTLACINAGSRILFSVAIDGLAPQPLQRTHPRHGLFSPLTFPYNILPYVFLGWTAVGIVLPHGPSTRSRPRRAVHRPGRSRRPGRLRPGRLGVARARSDASSPRRLTARRPGCRVGLPPKRPDLYKPSTA